MATLLATSPAPVNAATDRVLILGDTVTGGTASQEAQEATAKGLAVDIVDGATWSAMSTSQFATYRAIILGDPTCRSDHTGIAPAEGNARTWGSALTGNIVLLGTDPVYHDTFGTPGGGVLTRKGIDFAIDQVGKTGAYISLSCYYHGTAPGTPVPLLDGVGPGHFTVTGVGCYNNAHIVARHPVLAGMTDSDLSNWSCSVHEAFDGWPGSLSVLAIAKDFNSSYTASDGSLGPPYILAAGVKSFPLSLSPTSASGPPGSTHTVTAELLDNATAAPVAGQTIGFRIPAGPNTGVSGTCLPSTSCKTGADGRVSWTYASNGAAGFDTIQAWVDRNLNGGPDAGEEQTTAGMKWVGPSSTCTQVDQMVSSASLPYDQWNVTYGISKCEGLVISNVSLGSRLMAERMSLPYLDLQTCTGQSGTPQSVSDCATSVFRHIALRPSGDEPQTDPAAFTRVQLVSPDGRPEIFYSAAPKTAPCNGNRLCEHVNIQAQYRISLSPPTDATTDQYLLVTERYEFYRDFKEANNPKELACEPSQETLATLGPLSDCGRWKPVVFYQYHRGNSNQILVQLNAAERLHYTPDSLALRGSTFTRDCESGAPEVGCHGAGTVIGAKLEVFHDPLTGAEENPIPQETVIRAVRATDAGVVGNQAGRYDNVHMTPKSEVGLPIPPPGCPECAHMHWRWGGNLSSHATFGAGKPLLGDAEPGALPTNSRQQLDVAVIAYHSEELSPRNFMDLLPPANSNQLDMHQSTPTAFSGGASQGTETLNHPPGSCYKADDLRSWGQCGQVVWLSATTSALNVNGSGVGDEDSDTFFAFGGFFCGTCTDGQYSDFLGFKPHYSPGQNALANMSPGQHLRIAFGPLPGQLPSGVHTQLFDVLPAGMTNITVKVNQVSSSQFSKNLISCSQTVLSSGQTEVNCQIEQPSSPNGLPPPCTANTNGNFDGNTAGGPCIVISGDVAASPGDYENLVHVVWTDPSVLVAGNLRQIATITVH